MFTRPACGIALVSWITLSLCLAQASGAAELSAPLSRTLASADGQTRVSAVFGLPDLEDVEELTASFRSRNVSRATQHFMVVDALQRETRQAQAPFLAAVESLQQRGEVVGFTPYWIANRVVVLGSPEAIRTLSQHPTVDAVWLNLRPSLITPVDMRLPLSSRDETVACGVPPGVKAIRADKVWRELGVTGAGSIVACLDTGVDAEHEALSGKWRGRRASASSTWRSLTRPESTTPYDISGHGTHVMGTMCGLSEAGDSIGVAPGAEWIATNAVSPRVQLEQFTDFVLESFQWFADPDGDPTTFDDVPDVVQNSWGVSPEEGPFLICDDRWSAAIDHCEAAGVVVTFSAGNSGSGAHSMVSPADRSVTPLKNFSVGAVRATGREWPYPIAGFSSRGPSGCVGAAIKPELVAPGVDVYSSTPGNEYQFFSGTSMAGPHVAGVVALMREVNPELSPDEVKQILLDTARPYRVDQDNTFGYGLVDAYDAVLGAAAAADLGRLFGDVRVEGVPVSGAEVRIQGTERQWETGPRGQFGGFVSAGEYRVEACHPLFGTYESRAVQVTPGERVTVDFTFSDQVGPSVRRLEIEDATFSPGDSIHVQAELEDYSGVVSVDAYVRSVAGEWGRRPMRESLGQWVSRLPGRQFGANFDVYFRAVDGIGRVTHVPEGGEADPMRVTLRQSVLQTDVELDTGWSLAAEGDSPSGKWIRIDPYGTWYQGRPVSPADDHSRDGSACFVTGKGKPDVEVDRKDVDDGCVTLQSSEFSLAGLESAELEYWRWFANEGRIQAGSFEVSVSADGGDHWVVLETLYSSEAEWTEVSIELQGLVEFSNQVQMRFVACDFGDDSLIEAGVDDVWLRGSVPPVVAEQPDPRLLKKRVRVSPSPFTNQTELRLTLPEDTSVDLAIYDLSGRRIRQLWNGLAAAGETPIIWDGRSSLGERVPSGVYFYRMKTAQSNEDGRVFRIR